MELELKFEYLVNENEREVAKANFLNRFVEGETKTLNIVVGPYKGSSFEKKMGEYLSYKLGIAHSDIVENGLFIKKRTALYTTTPMTISEETMDNLSNTYFDVILAFGVKVDVTAA